MDGNGIVARLEAFLATEEGKKSLQEWGDRLQAKQDAKVAKHEELQLLSNEEFKNIIIRQEELHDEAYEKSCYDRGYLPNPQPELELIFDVMMAFGEEFEPEEWNTFASGYWKYKGLTCVLYQGQGSFVRVYDGDECLIQI